MRAIVITEPGGPEVLAERDVATPEPGRGEVRVRVHATALNRADLLQRMGRYPAPPGWPVDVPGLEYAGVVDAVGAGVSRWSAGDRVMGLVGGGAYAEYVVVHEGEAMGVPDTLDLPAAAAVPEAFITAHDALFTRVSLRPGERLLIHAVGSGVGTAGLQLAVATGATVLGTARTEWKLERASELGLAAGFDGSTPDWADAVLGVTEGQGVDAILDLVGAAYFEASLRALARQGRMVHVGTISGARAELDIRTLMQHRLTLVGTVLRARPLGQKIEAARRFEHEIGPLLADGRVRPIVDRVMSFEQVAEAHEAMASNLNFGKIVLRW